MRLFIRRNCAVLYVQLRVRVKEFINQANDLVDKVLLGVIGNIFADDYMLYVHEKTFQLVWLQLLGRSGLLLNYLVSFFGHFNFILLFNK